MIERPQTFNDLLVEFLHEEPPGEAPDKVAEVAATAARPNR